MASLTNISSEQSVRQVAVANPVCADILRNLPGALHDDRWTLQQLGPFARQAGIDKESLLEQLSRAARVPIRGANSTSHRTGSPLPLIFTALIVGISLGTAFGVGLLLRIATGARYDAVPAASVHVHGLAQLWGWMTLFIFGVGGHLVRQNTTRPAPRWLDGIAGGFIVVGLLVFLAGLSQRVRELFPLIDIAGSALLLAAAIFFAFSIIWSLHGAANGQRRHGLIALVLWLWAWAAIDLWLRVRYIDAQVLPDWARSLLITLPVLGLATNAIYGFGLRLIPGLLNIGQLRQRWFGPALLLHNVGVCLFLIPLRIPQALGAVFMLVGAICYLVGMDGLRSKPSRPIFGIDPRGHILIRAAFLWLLFGLAMIVGQQVMAHPPHAYSGAWRHALTVGFVTTMIMGVGYRILPVFIKQPLASTHLMLVSTVLILTGNFARVTLEVLTIGAWTWSFHLMGLSGVLELAALILFAINIAATALNRVRIYSANEPLKSDTRVQDAVNARPELQERLRSLGITMFDSVPFIAPSMTFGALALASGMTPRQLVDALNERSNQAGRGSSGNLDNSTPLAGRAHRVAN